MSDRTAARVVLVDDHAVYRAGLELLLRQSGVEIVGEGDDVASGIAAIERAQPDVAVVDMHFPDGDGLALVREIVARVPRCRVLILSASSAYAREAIDAGASGYALKTGSREAIVNAVHIVAGGGSYTFPAFARAGHDDPLRWLSRRERDVFRLAIDGLSTAEIAQRLGVAEKTVESHRASINRKLDVHSNAELLRFALARGLLRPSSA